MSEYRVGMIAEGPTDIHLITGVLGKCFPEHSFLLDWLSPSPEELSMQKSKTGGFGWASVYRTCNELRRHLALSTCAGGFDFLVIHLDGDVAFHTYASAGISGAPGVLPCAATDDAIPSVCAKLEDLLWQWIGDTNGIRDIPRIVFCIPYIVTETWAGALVFPESWEAISEDSSEGIVYEKLLELGRPKKEKGRRLVQRKSNDKIQKVRNTYRAIAVYITPDTWREVVHRYGQAEKFDRRLRDVM